MEHLKKKLKVIFSDEQKFALIWINNFYDLKKFRHVYLGSIEWVNQKLARSWPGYAKRVDAQYPVRSLKDMHDGVLMICLLETLYDCELKKELKCRMRLHKVNYFIVFIIKIKSYLKSKYLL